MAKPSNLQANALKKMDDSAAVPEELGVLERLASGVLGIALLCGCFRLRATLINRLR